MSRWLGDGGGGDLLLALFLLLLFLLHRLWRCCFVSAYNLVEDGVAFLPDLSDQPPREFQLVVSVSVVLLDAVEESLGTRGVEVGHLEGGTILKAEALHLVLSVY